MSCSAREGLRILIFSELLEEFLRSLYVITKTKKINISKTSLKMCFKGICFFLNDFNNWVVIRWLVYPASILRKSTSGRHRPVSYPDGPMTARYRFT